MAHRKCMHCGGEIGVDCFDPNGHARIAYEEDQEDPDGVWDLDDDDDTEDEGSE